MVIDAILILLLVLIGMLVAHGVYASRQQRQTLFAEGRAKLYANELQFMNILMRKGAEFTSEKDGSVTISIPTEKLFGTVSGFDGGDVELDTGKRTGSGDGDTGTVTITNDPVKGRVGE